MLSRAHDIKLFTNQHRSNFQEELMRFMRDLYENFQSNNEEKSIVQKV